MHLQIFDTSQMSNEFLDDSDVVGVNDENTDSNSPRCGSNVDLSSVATALGKSSKAFRSIKRKK